MKKFLCCCTSLFIAGGKDDETADKYFQRVMESTGTVILWPSKLKIGAKSKKGWMDGWMDG